MSTHTHTLQGMLSTDTAEGSLRQGNSKRRDGGRRGGEKELSLLSCTRFLLITAISSLGLWEGLSRASRSAFTLGTPWVNTQAPKHIYGLYLHDGVGGQHLLLHVGLAGRTADGSKVPHGILGRHRLPRPRLAAHDDGLIPLVPDGAQKNTHRVRGVCVCVLSGSLQCSRCNTYRGAQLGTEVSDGSKRKTSQPASE